MFKQINIDKSTILGTASVGRVIRPYLTGAQKKNAPDMSSTVPYFPALNGTTLTVTVEGDVTATSTITFTGNSMTQAVADININPDIEASDTFGYLTITSKHSGNRNLIKVVGGTSTSILGFYVYPHPMGISFAGEIDSGKPTYYENRSKGSTAILEREPVQKEVFNRSGAGISYILDSLLSNLNREIAVTKEYDVAIAGTSFTISSDDRFYLPIDNIFIPNPSQTQLERAVTITDGNHNLLFDSTGNRIGITSITYGPLVDPTLTFASWTVADGKSVFGPLSHYQKIKATGSITEVVGSIIHCPGATFVTNKVQVNDPVVISGATNITPYNHDGEYCVDEVISEEYLRIRPRGVVDPSLVTSFAPSSVNPIKNIGEVYGTLTVYLGKFCPLNMKAGSMTFNLSSALNGTYKVTLPIGRTLSQVLQTEFVQYLLQKESGGQIELGSKLSSSLLPRIIVKPVSKTLILESLGSPAAFRIYSLPAGGVEMTYNAKWNGASYVKDDNTKEATIITESVNGVLLSTDNLSITLDTTTQKIVNKYQTACEFSDGMNTTLSIPSYTGLVNGNATFKSGIYLGSGFSSDAEHLVPKIQFNSNSAAGKYTLLSESILSAARKRDYVKDDGTTVITTNAAWDGTQWVKDVAANPSTKAVLDNDTFKVYKKTLNIGTFSDTSWSSKEELKHYFIDEDFMRGTSTIFTDITSGTFLSSYFYSSSTSNLQIKANPTPSSDTYGEVIIRSKNVAAFTTYNYTGFLNTGSNTDFDLNIKAACPDNTSLATSGTSDTGILIGVYDMIANNYTVALKAASDKTVWYVQVQGSIFDTTVPTSSYINILFRRVNGVLYTYANGSLIDTRGFSVALSAAPVEITITGTATSPNNELLYVDFVRFWSSTTTR